MVKNESSNIRFGVKLPFAPLETVFQTALLAERLHFDSIWYPDHLLSLNPLDWSAYSCWCILSAVARENKKCIIGSSVADCNRYNVAVLGQSALTLHKISDGRFVLGVGLGEAQNLIPYGLSYDKNVKRLSEYIIALRQLWTNDEVDFHGKHVNLTKAALRPLLGVNIPIWVGANSEKTIKLTAELADGWIPLAVKFAPLEYLRVINDIRHLRGGLSNFVPALFFHTLADKNRDKAWNRAKNAGKLMLLMWVPHVFEEYGYSVERQFHANKLVFNNDSVRKLLDKLNQLPSEPLYSRLPVGSPDECIDFIDKYIKAGVSHFILSFLSGPDTIVEDIRFYREYVLDYFVR